MAKGEVSGSDVGEVVSAERSNKRLGRFVAPLHPYDYNTWCSSDGACLSMLLSASTSCVHTE